MTNLLPSDQQRSVWAFYRARFLIAAALVLILFAAVAAISLIPSYLALELASPPAPGSASSTSRATTDGAVLARAQTIIRIVKPLAQNATTTSDIIRGALDARPKGVLVKHIAIQTGDQSQMTISGTAGRDAVSAYHDALQKLPFFTSVSVPVNALVGSDNGAFSITLTGAF